MLKEGMFIQGRYEIVGKIGTGGMADVYKAKDHKLNRFVAVKVLKEEFRADKVFITKFRAEAQAAAGLAHPNIVNIYDTGEDHGMYFIVMELVEGITLKEYIAKKGKLAVREATSIAIQVSQGLEAAHGSGIIHRDVKPQNIIISTDGKVKVTDFGIARAATNHTISTTVMGSVHYTSPEQARGGYSDAKSDIYSLGISLYEMLTGRVPFDGESTVAIAIKHLQEEMKSPELYVPDLPRSTVQIINKCTQKSPDRRYANMMELIRDLKESLINPEGDFVRIANANSAGRTVVISREELGAIKDGYNPAGAGQSVRQEPQNPGGMGAGGMNGGMGPAGGMNAGMNGGMGAPVKPNDVYEPYTYGMDSRAYGNRGYDYQEEMYEGRGFQDEDDEKGMLNSRLEKIMTVGSIIIAILIGCIFLGLAASALGIFKFSLPGLFGAQTQTEKQTEATKPAQTQDTPGQQDTQGSQQQTNAVTETQAPQTTEAPTEAPEEDPMRPQEPTEIPDVTGKYYENAMDILMSAGFYVQRQDDPNDDYPAGMVLEQSMTGNAEPGSTVILIVSSGPASGADVEEVWMCNVQLDAPTNYNGGAARLVLEQNGTTTILAQGDTIAFPYDLNVKGEAGTAMGTVYLDVLNSATGAYESIVQYDVPFSRVN